MSTTAETVAWRPSDSIANRVLLTRNSLGLNQKDFCKLTGLTRGKLQGIENGRHPHDETAMLARVALATGVDRDWLAFGGELGTKNPPDPNGPGGIRERATRDSNPQPSDPKVLEFPQTPNLPRVA